jgi:hypothetical protein
MRCRAGHKWLHSWVHGLRFRLGTNEEEIAMHRDRKPGKNPASSEIGRSLLTLTILVLVGMGFTLMSASAFSGHTAIGQSTGSVSADASLRRF